MIVLSDEAECVIASINVTDLPRLPEGTAMDSPKSSTPPPPIEKDSVRSVSSSRHRPPLPPKERERRRSRGSTLQLVAANPELLVPQQGVQKRRSSRRHPNVIINQLSTIKHWLVESAKRAKSPGLKLDTPTKTPPNKSPAQLLPTSGQPPNKTATETMVIASPHSNKHTGVPRSRYSNHRNSLSPAPLTPHSSTYRRSSAGLRGRKSTSSSVSSVRSMHHAHTHSKASSTSSTSNSVRSSAINKPLPVARSPHNSVKVLPATPTNSTFPSNMRLVRTTPPPLNLHSNLDERTFGGALPSPGLVFAKRKKTPFRGPMLHINSNLGSSSSSRSRESSVGARGGSLPPNNRGPTITEEDEEEIEEVDTFSPIGPNDLEETLEEPFTEHKTEEVIGEPEATKSL